MKIVFSVVTFGHSIKDICPLLQSINGFRNLIDDVYLYINENKSLRGYLLDQRCFYRIGVPVVYSRTENIGYGAANNRNFELLDGCSDLLFVVCNPDITFTAKGLENLTAIFERGKGSLACVAPLINNLKGNVQYSVKKEPTVLSLILGRCSWLRIIPILSRYDFWHKNMDADYLNDEIQANYLSGCFLVIHGSFYKRVGGFDENIFLHLEDADIVKRLSLIGRTIHSPSVYVVHGWARGSHRSFRQMFCLVKSSFQFFYKHGLKLY